LTEFNDFAVNIYFSSPGFEFPTAGSNARRAGVVSRISVAQWQEHPANVGSTLRYRPCCVLSWIAWSTMQLIAVAVQGHAG